MASFQADRQQSEYGKMKRNVANSLTVMDALNLATIFNFSPASMGELESSKAPGFLLLRILEQHCILASSKVDELEEALHEVSQEMAARHVQQYKKNTSLSVLQRQLSDSSIASEDSGIAAAGGSQPLMSFSQLDLEDESAQPVEAFCNHCNQVITWRSAASEHSSHNHEVIPGESISSEAYKRRTEIRAELKAMTENMKASQEAVSDEMHHGSLSKMVDEVERLAKEFKEKVEIRKKELIDHLSRSEADRAIEVEEYKKEVNEMLQLCNDLEKNLPLSVGVNPSDSLRRSETPSSVGDLVHMNEVKKKITRKRHSINAKLKHVQENRSRLFLTETPNDGHFAQLLDSTLAGIVWLLEDQVAMVYDERRTLGSIEVKCFEGLNAEVECWYKSIDTADSVGPVTVSSIEYYNGPYPHILLAAGKMVYMLRLSYDGNHFDGICDTKSYDLKMASEAYVTAISAHEQGSKHRDKFVVANNLSLDVFQYNGICELDRQIDCSAFVSSILSIAAVNDTVAVVDNLSKTVQIIKYDGRVASLMNTISPSICDPDAMPWTLLWTGALWLILWVPSTDASSKWWVSSQNEDGGQVQLYDGEFSKIKFPVAISRFIYGIMVSFSDSSFYKCEQI